MGMPIRSSRSSAVSSLHASFGGGFVGSGDDWVMLGSSVPMGLGLPSDPVHAVNAAHVTRANHITRACTE
jgi:hypothetical protein